jgi:hypothetical protein
VLPIVLYLKVGLDGIGVDAYVEELWGLEIRDELLSASAGWPGSGKSAELSRNPAWPKKAA